MIMVIDIEINQSFIKLIVMKIFKVMKQNTRNKHRSRTAFRPYDLNYNVLADCV